MSDSPQILNQHSFDYLMNQQNQFLNGHIDDSPDFNDHIFNNVLIQHAQLHECPFERTRFINCTFVHINFHQSDFTMAYFENCTFIDVDFYQAYVQFNEWKNCKIIDCSFNETDISHSVFKQCTSKNSPLSTAIQQNTQFNP